MIAEKKIRRAAALSLAYNIAQTLVKVAAAFLTGSVAITTEAAHSGTDLLASGLSFLALRISVKEPDDDHPYGHGKFDSLAGFAEAVLLLGFALVVGFVAIARLIRPAPIVEGGLGAYLVGLTAIGAFIVSIVVKRAALQTGSASLRSNAQHLRVDAFTSVSVLIGVLLADYAHLPWLDPVVALVLAVVLSYEASILARKAFGEVVDERIEPDEREKIEAVLAAEAEVRGWHRLRTRHSGPVHDVDLHIVLPDAYTVAQGHEIAHRIETRIAEALAPARCVVHVDPESDADHDD